MATIDSRIALGFQPQTQLESAPNALAKMLQLQGAQQESQMRGMQMQDAADARVSKNKLAELYRTSIGADGKVDRNRLLQGAAQQGLGAQIPGLQKEFADADEQQGKIGKTAAETEKLQIATARDQLTLLGQLAGGIRDQASYDQAKALAQSKGVDVSAFPPQYDPATVQAFQQQALTAEEQLAQVWKQKGYDLDTQKFGETKRSNLAGEGLQRRGQDITVRGQNLTDARGRESNDIARAKVGQAGPDGRPSKPMPATALKMQNEAVDMIGIASSIQADLGTIEQQLEKGKLDFGPVKNVANNLKNMAGMSDEQSRNFSTFKSSMEKLRNDSLRLNKGVQTDGDAQRAWNELFQNINDKGLVKQRLAEIKAINARAVDLRKREVEDIRNNYNQQQYDFSTQNNVPSAITPPKGGANIDALLEKYK